MRKKKLITYHSYNIIHVRKRANINITLHPERRHRIATQLSPYHILNSCYCMRMCKYRCSSMGVKLNRKSLQLHSARCVLLKVVLTRINYQIIAYIVDWNNRFFFCFFFQNFCVNSAYKFTRKNHHWLAFTRYTVSEKRM